MFVPFDYPAACQYHEHGVELAKRKLPIKLRKGKVGKKKKQKATAPPTEFTKGRRRCNRHKGCDQLQTMSQEKFDALCQSWRLLPKRVRKERIAPLVSNGKHKLRLEGNRETLVCSRYFHEVTGIGRGPVRTVRARVSANVSVTQVTRGGNRWGKLDGHKRDFYQYVNTLSRENPHYASQRNEHTVLTSNWTQKAIVLGWLHTKNPEMAKQQELIMTRRAKLDKQLCDSEEFQTILVSTSRCPELAPLPKGEVYITPPVSPSTLIKWLCQLNVSRGKPAVDLCDKCTLFDHTMLASTDDDEIPKVMNQKLKHLRDAHIARLMSQALIATAGDDLKHKHKDVFMSDLGSHIGIPRGVNSSAYYQAQTHTKLWWVTNFGLDPLGIPHAYLWPDYQMGQGTNAIISAYLLYLAHKSPAYGKQDPEGDPLGSISSFSDRCSGQELNWTFLSLNMYICEELKWFRSIDQYFFVSGHSYMGGRGPDAIHSAVKREVGPDPNTFQEVVAAANKVDTVHATVMKLTDFRNYRKFLEQYFAKPRENSPSSPYYGKNVDTSGMPVRLSMFTSFNFGKGRLYHKCTGKYVEHDHPGEVWARRSYDPKENPTRINLRRKRPGKAKPKARNHADFDLALKGMKAKTLTKILKNKFLTPEAQKEWRDVAKLLGWSDERVQEAIVSDTVNDEKDEMDDVTWEEDDQRVDPEMGARESYQVLCPETDTEEETAKKEVIMDLIRQAAIKDREATAPHGRRRSASGRKRRLKWLTRKHGARRRWRKLRRQSQAGRTLVRARLRRRGQRRRGAWHGLV